MVVRFYPFLLVALILLQVGCKATYVDISENAELSHLIGKSYEVLSDLHIIGGYWGNEKKLDYYVVYNINKVGSGGPGKFSSGVLASGSKFKIIKILKCTNCLLEAPIDAVIKLLGSEVDFKEGIPVKLVDQDFFVKSKGSELIMLDKLLFKEL